MERRPNAPLRKEVPTLLHGAGFQSRVPLAFISILPGIHANHTEKWGVPLVMYGG